MKHYYKLQDEDGDEFKCIFDEKNMRMYTLRTDANGLYLEVESLVPRIVSYTLAFGDAAQELFEKILVSDE